jgi:hypothetical protein
MIMPTPESPYFSRFDPSAITYIHPGNPGSYSSNMVGVPAYLLAFRNLVEAFDDTYIRDILLFMMYYDFMAFLAVSYSKSIVVGFTLLQARTTIVTQLNNLLELTDLSRYEDFIKVMLIIANQMIPAPPAPRKPPLGLRPRTPHLRCAVISSQPPDGFFPPSDENTSENDEEEEAYSTHSTPQRSGTVSEQIDEEYILRHPGKIPAQAPSPMRAAMSERFSPLAINTSPQSMRKKLRSPLQKTVRRL